MEKLKAKLIALRFKEEAQALVKQIPYIGDAFFSSLEIGKWSVYYGEGQLSYAMRYETASFYMEHFNAPCIIKVRGWNKGTVLNNPNFNIVSYQTTVPIMRTMRKTDIASLT